MPKKAKQRGPVNVKAVETLKKRMKPEPVIAQLSETFKALGDPTRTRILLALCDLALCVYDLALLLNMSQSAISHQLGVLRHLKLVKYKRQGRGVYYSLDDEHIRHLLYEGIKHVEE